MNYIEKALNKLKYLVEDIDSVKQKFPNIADDTFMELISLDPTYKDGINSVGTYGKWILNLYNKGKIKESDFDLVNEALRLFEEKKKWFTNKDIGQFKSLEELQKRLDEVEVGEVSHARQIKDVRKKARETDLTVDADLMYEDNKWIVYIPNTYEASCKLGQGSKWCTATKETDSYYDEYTSQGNLFIVINKNNPKEKYQLHEETQSFMDINDEPFEPNEQFSNEEDKGLLEYLNYAMELPASYKDMLKKLFNVDSDDSKITYLLNMSKLQDYLLFKLDGSYRDRDRINLDFALQDHYDWFIGDYDYVTLNDVDTDEIDAENKNTMLKLTKAENEDADEIDYELFEDALIISMMEGLSSGSYGDYIEDVNLALKSIMEDCNIKIQIMDEDSIEITGTLDSFYNLTMGTRKEMIDEDIIDIEYDNVKGCFDEILYNALNKKFELDEPYYGWQGFDSEAFNERLGDELYEMEN